MAGYTQSFHAAYPAAENRRALLPGWRKNLTLVLSKKRGVNAFPYSMRVSRAAGSVQRLVAKHRQPVALRLEAQLRRLLQGVD